LRVIVKMDECWRYLVWLHTLPCRLVDYNAALATICFMLFLGFADDVLDIPWRVKLILPCIASLPLLIAYTGGTGGRCFVTPVRPP
jgi:UDP-N-acetylmuramyl pentapeptide phosphotransferase/UDP-N-acetylglucosamine-1-phosphate transferase